MRRASLLLILAALALLGAGCGSGGSDTATAGLPDEADLEGQTPAELKIAADVRHTRPTSASSKPTKTCAATWSY